MPAEVRWYAAKFTPPYVGYADGSTKSIYLDESVVRVAGSPYARTVMRHELAHLVVGWRANHPVVPQTGGVVDSEPRSIFGVRCDTGWQ